MKKLTIVFCTVLLSANLVMGQTVYLSQQVIASAGASSSAIPNWSVDWTVGESLTTTLTGAHYMITQGFHQPFDIGVGIEETSLDGLGINVYPNPTADLINVRFENNTKDLLLDLYDLNGKLLQTKKIESQTVSTQFSMAPYAVAHYILLVYDSNQTINYTYKIEKLN